MMRCKAAACMLLALLARPALADIVTPSEPAPELERAQIVIEIAGEEDTVENEIWTVPVLSAQGKVEFTWPAVEGAQVYLLEILNEKNEVRFSGEKIVAKLELPAEKAMDGVHTLRVRAMAGEETLQSGEIRFRISLSDLPGDMGQMGGFPGGMGQMGGSRGGAMSMIQQEPGFRVTPGEKLTGSHSSGDKDMRLYGAVELSAQEEPMQRLALGGEELDIDAGGALFTAEIAEDTLFLISDGDHFELNMRALETLRLSGVAAVSLDIGGTERLIGTDIELQGREYAALRAAGFVSKDIVLRVCADGIEVHVNGNVYTLEDSSEMTGRREE